MNFLKSSNKQNTDPGNSTGERRRLAQPSRLVMTGLAIAGLFLTGCAEAKEAPQTPAPATTSVTTEAAPTPTTPRETLPAPTTPETADKFNTQALKNIQAQAHERWPGTGKNCAFAFYKNGVLNVDVIEPSLMAAIEELAYQGNPDIVPAELAGREPSSTYTLSQDQKDVIALSAQYIAEQTGPIDEPGGRIGICKVPQGTVDENESTFIVLDRGPSKEVTNK